MSIPTRHIINNNGNIRLPLPRPVGRPQRRRGRLTSRMTRHIINNRDSGMFPLLPRIFGGPQRRHGWPTPLYGILPRTVRRRQHRRDRPTPRMAATALIPLTLSTPPTPPTPPTSPIPPTLLPMEHTEFSSFLFLGGNF
ncbi:hypothetical protein F8M41_008865 [Gigaspora margarita]|uniref:Uncharacterized protein n=1 Tax=Gigaspora margarita TaxID=4874 RepID=A0A8H4A3H2_GIGMA|nr:hypothetical protein F8M41_008865 [Gigaspora margarita]